MSNGSAATVVTNTIAQAIKALGVVVEVSAEDFLGIVRRGEHPLVVHAQSKLIRTRHKYLTSYKGLAFYTIVAEPLSLPGAVEVVEAKKLSVPEM